MERKWRGNGNGKEMERKWKGKGNVKGRQGKARQDITVFSNVLPKCCHLLSLAFSHLQIGDM